MQFRERGVVSYVLVAASGLPKSSGSVEELFLGRTTTCEGVLVFESYSERARRAPYLAGIEARKLGSSQIETEHLLLVLLRQDKALAHRFLRSDDAFDSIRRRIEAHGTVGSDPCAPLNPSFSSECALVFDYAHEQAARLGHKHIGTEHLFLGLMQNADCFAAKILAEHDLQFASVLRKFEISDDRNKQMCHVYCVKCQGYGKVGRDAAASRSLWRMLLRLPQRLEWVWETCSDCDGRGYSLMSPIDYRSYEVAIDNRIETERRQSAERARRDAISKQQEARNAAVRRAMNSDHRGPWCRTCGAQYSSIGSLPRKIAYHDDQIETTYCPSCGSENIY